MATTLQRKQRKGYGVESSIRRGKTNANSHAAMRIHACDAWTGRSDFLYTALRNARIIQSHNESCAIERMRIQSLTTRSKPLLYKPQTRKARPTNETSLRNAALTKGKSKAVRRKVRVKKIFVLLKTQSAQRNHQTCAHAPARTGATGTRSSNTLHDFKETTLLVQTLRIKVFRILG